MIQKLNRMVAVVGAGMSKFGVFPGVPSRDLFVTAYREALANGKLLGARCAECDSVYLPPRPHCGVCGVGKMVWEEIEGGGVIETFSNIHFPGLDLQAAGFGREMPGCAAIVRLDEGPAISAQIVGPDKTSTPEVRVGDRVRAEFVRRGQGEAERVFLVFMPEPRGGRRR